MQKTVVVSVDRYIKHPKIQEVYEEDEQIQSPRRKRRIQCRGQGYNPGMPAIIKRQAF